MGRNGWVMGVSRGEGDNGANGCVEYLDGTWYDVDRERRKFIGEGTMEG